jgi:VanZ family protein
MIPLFVSVILIASLYWGLSQAESRAIYASWDKVLHAAVFFLIWWLLRWSVRFSWVWVTALVIAGGGAEEIHQLWQVGHVADWGDWLADIAGVAVALSIYTIGRLLWLLRESVAEPTASDAPLSQARGQGAHDVDWRFTLRLWRWEYYFVMLAGHNRRALSVKEQIVARWGVILLIGAFSITAGAVGLVAAAAIKVALGV